jgi:hypothetical protein
MSVDRNAPRSIFSTNSVIRCASKQQVVQREHAKGMCCPVVLQVECVADITGHAYCRRCHVRTTPARH